MIGLDWTRWASIRALALFATALAIRAADPIDAIVLHVASTQESLPWVWSSTAEGLADIPYTYQVRLTRRVLARNGKEALPSPGASPLAAWRDLQLERIPLDWGSFLRCLAENGKSPCSAEWNGELDRQVKRRDQLSVEDRTRIDADREERRRRRQAFWRDFPSAFRFQIVEGDQVRFVPAGNFQPRNTNAGGMLTAIQGRLWFDASTHEITRLEYDLVRAVGEPFIRLPKGTHFEIALAKSADGHYLPERMFVRRPTGKSGQIEETTAFYSQFRRFRSESNIEFGDPKDSAKERGWPGPQDRIAGAVKRTVFIPRCYAGEPHT